MSSLRKFSTIAVALLLTTSFALAQTHVLTPDQVPKGAYVNGSDGDHQFIQQIVITVGANWAVASADVDITITLPDSMTIADTDGDNASNLLDEITLIEASGATGITMVATPTTITIDGTAGNVLLGETFTFIFPVTTQAGAATGSQNYSIGYTDDAIGETGGTVAVTFQDTLTLLTWDTAYEGDDDQSSTLGDVYPVASDNFFTAGINLVADAAAVGAGQAGNVFFGAALDATDDNGEVLTYIWASQIPALSRIDNMNGHRPFDVTAIPIRPADNDGVETVGAIGAAAPIYQLDGTLLAEGDWWFYLTSSATGNWVLATSDTVDIRHHPTFVALTTDDGAGFDYDIDNAYTTGGGGDDVALVTLESGGTIGKDAALVTGANDLQSLEFFWDYEDVDDNAVHDIFLSTVDALVADSVVVTGTSPNEVVSTIGTGARKITSASISEDGSTGSFTYNIYTDAATFEPAGTFYIYVVANDGKNQTVYQLATFGGLDKQVSIKHYPNFVFDDVYNNLAVANVDPTNIATDTDDYYVISWGATPASGLGDGDQDADGDATITLYYSATDLDGIIAAAVPTSVLDGALLTDPIWTAAVTSIGSTTENLDDPEDNRMMWNIGAAGLTAATDYFIIAHIAEGVDNLFVQYTSALGPVEALAPILLDREVRAVHGAYLRAESPLAGETITLNGDDEFKFQWEAYDRDDIATNFLHLFMVPTGTAPAADHAAEVVAATAGTYWITSTGTGQTNVGVAAGPSPESGEYVLDVSDITADAAGGAARPSGFYDVYYFVSYDGTMSANEAPVLAPGVLRFTGSTATALNFSLTPNMASVSKGDIITVSVIGQSSSALNVSIVSISIDVPNDYFTVIDQGSGAPFVDNDVNFAGSSTPINEMRTNGSVTELDFTEIQSTPAVTLAAADLVMATFDISVTSAGSGTELLSNLITFVNSAGRTTGIVDENGQSETLTIAAPAADIMLAPAGGIGGQIELEVLTDNGKSVDVHVLPRGSYTPITDADFITANGPANADGSVSVTLGADGAYSLTSIPTGDYDILVHRTYHLDQLSEGVSVRPVNTTTVDFLAGDMLLTGDIAGRDDDTDISTTSVPDGQINATDVTAMTTAFGATVDSSNWNAGADLDGSGKVYIEDYNVVTANSGSNSEGLIFKSIPVDANENVVARLLAMEEIGDEVTYSIELSNLRSLHAYAVEMDFNPADWEMVSFADGMGNYAKAIPFSKRAAFGGTYVSGIIGYNVVRSSEMTLVNFTLRKKNMDAGEVSISEISLVDGARNVAKAIIETEADLLPTEFSLEQNFPNPFNPVTTIRFKLPMTGNVKLVVYNLLGQEVKTLMSGAMDAGSYKAVWNSRDNMGRKVGSGMYIYRLVVDNNVVDIRKMVLLK